MKQKIRNTLYDCLTVLNNAYGDHRSLVHTRFFQVTRITKKNIRYEVQCQLITINRSNKSYLKNFFKDTLKALQK